MLASSSSSSRRLVGLCSWESWEASELGISAKSVSLVDFDEEEARAGEPDAESQTPAGPWLPRTPTCEDCSSPRYSQPDVPRSPRSIALGPARAKHALPTCSSPSSAASSQPSSNPHQPSLDPRPHQMSYHRQPRPAGEGCRVKSPSSVSTQHSSWMSRSSDCSSESGEENTGEQLPGEEGLTPAAPGSGGCKGLVPSRADALHGGGPDACWPHRLYSEMPKAKFKNSSLSQETKLIQEWIESYERQSGVAAPFSHHALTNVHGVALQHPDARPGVDPAAKGNSSAGKSSSWPRQFPLQRNCNAGVLKPALRSMRSMPPERNKASLSVSFLPPPEATEEMPAVNASAGQLLGERTVAAGRSADCPDEVPSGPTSAVADEMSGGAGSAGLCCRPTSSPLPLPPAMACRELDKSSLVSREGEKPSPRSCQRISGRTRSGIPRTRSLPACAEEDYISPGSSSSRPDVPPSEESVPFTPAPEAKAARDPKSRRHRPSLQISVECSKAGDETEPEAEAEGGRNLWRDIGATVMSQLRLVPQSPTSGAEACGGSKAKGRVAGKGGSSKEARAPAQSLKATPRGSHLIRLRSEKLLLPHSPSLENLAAEGPLTPSPSGGYTLQPPAEGSELSFGCDTKAPRTPKASKPGSAGSAHSSARKCRSHSCKPSVSKHCLTNSQPSEHGGGKGLRRSGSLLLSPKDTLLSVWSSMRRTGDSAPGGGSALQSAASMDAHMREKFPEFGNWEVSSSGGMEGFSKQFKSCRKKREAPCQSDGHSG